MEKNLNDIEKGKDARIVSIRGSGKLHKRLLDMGITSGAEVQVKNIAPLGDPIEITVRGYSLSLRKEEAKNIAVEEI